MGRNVCGGHRLEKRACVLMMLSSQSPVEKFLLGLSIRLNCDDDKLLSSNRLPNTNIICNKIESNRFNRNSDLILLFIDDTKSTSNEWLCKSSVCDVTRRRYTIKESLNSKISLQPTKISNKEMAVLIEVKWDINLKKPYASLFTIVLHYLVCILNHMFNCFFFCSQFYMTSVQANTNKMTPSSFIGSRAKKKTNKNNNNTQTLYSLRSTLICPFTRTFSVRLYKQNSINYIT